MIDNITNTSKGVQQAVGGSLATALRDRQAYVIPIQPNRSLPVRPAPHHTPSRTSIVKTSLARSSRSFVGSIHSGLVIDAGKAIESSPLPSNVPDNPDQENPKDKDSAMKRTLNIQNVVTTSENFIDISRSPERIDLSEEISICPSRLDSSSPGCWVHGSVIPREKRKRRRKGKRANGEEVPCGNPESAKTVPPLRLKKIQTLQEPRIASGGSNWAGIAREINDGFNVEARILRAGEYGNFATGMSNKYRIVTGHSPPYEECVGSCIDSSTEPRIDSLDIAKLRYRQTKLKLKLRELRRKTLELGNEMLRSVLTPSSGPKGSRLRQTMTRYEGQIKHLEKMINELPDVSYAEDNGQNNWSGYREEDQGHFQENREESGVISPARTICSSNSSSLCSSPSLEPPKLSPRSPTNYEAARSPSQVRNSPPVLPRVYVPIADCDEERDARYSRRGRTKRRNRSPLVKPTESIAGPSSPVISTTGENIIKDNVELLLEEEDFGEKSFFEIGKSDLEIVEVYDEPKGSKNVVVKGKAFGESQEDVKPPVKRLASPLTVEIDTTSVDNDYEAKPQVLREINGATGNQVNQVNQVMVNAQSSASACGIGEHLRESRAEKEKESKEDIVTVREDDVVLNNNNGAGNALGIGEQFPTLGNWIARLAKKQVNNVETSNKLPDAPHVDERASAFQIFGGESGKPTTPEVPRTVAARPVVEEAVNVAPQWRADRWQEQQAPQPQTLPQSYAPTLPLPPPPPPPPLSQEFCSPIAMARLYTRNYAIDPYSVAYGYNPAIAAAAATASLWNSAAILQYPLMRPSSSLLNSQQGRIPAGSLQFPASAQPLQRPNYRVSVMQQNDGKRGENSLNYSRDGKIIPSGYQASFEQAKRASVEYHHAVTATGQNRGMSCNSVNGQTINYRNCLQQQHQSTEQQQQFARANYSDNSMRLPVPGASWRTGHVLGNMGNDFNYGTTSPWSSATSGNILNSIVRASTPGFVSASTIAINSRARSSKDSGDSNARNCETPHLGKVNYSPNTVSNLECSNCGLAGSLFKCLGCEIAFYCDENCQARHWNRHVISCPKKMPKLKKVGH